MSWKDKINTIWHGNASELLKEIPNNSIDLVLTDPPYNISQKSGGLRKLDFGEWDKQGNEIVATAVEEAVRISKGTIIFFCSNQQFSYIYNFLEGKNFITKCLVWLKPNPSVINCEHSYVTGQELMVYAKKRNALYNPNFKLSYFTYPFPVQRLHPTQKPIELIKELILDTTDKDNLILDPFMGSWTTARACMDLGRNFIGAELSAEYCEIGRQRLRQQVLI